MLRDIIFPTKLLPNYTTMAFLYDENDGNWLKQIEHTLHIFFRQAKIR